MDLNFQTLAQRKAARRSQIQTPETQPPAEVSGTEPAPVPTPTPSQSSPAEPKVNSAPSVPAKTSASFTNDPNSIDKEKLIALARSMGLELSQPKKIWIKHSYSVTPDSKEKFAKYCEVLGVKMQDGLEEALQDWFRKKESEFKAVSTAKQT